MLQDELNHPSLFLLNKGLNLACPIISIVHHLRCSELRPVWQNWLYRIVERRYLRGIDAFIFNSQTTCQTVNKLIGNTAPHIVAYPAGDRFVAWQKTQSPSPPKTPTLRILFVGNVSLRKGLHVLLNALAVLTQQHLTDWHLNIVGNNTSDTAYAKEIRSQMTRLNLAQHIQWLGSIDDEQLAQQYTQHDVFVLPSQYEGFGIVYLEAMSFGLPVIASTAGAAPEIIDDGVDGFLIPPEDPTTLAARLQTLYHHRPRLREMGNAARQRFERHPTWAHTMHHIREFLQQMTAA